MRYKEYGQAFKEIRLHKGLSLSELEYVSGVSKSSLSQFENGRTMLSFGNLEHAVEAMCTTLLDYSLVMSNGEPEYFISQFQKIEYLALKQDKLKLEEVYEVNIRNGEKGTDLIALCAKTHYSNWSFQELEMIEEYFKAGQEWGLYDLHLLLNILDQININFLMDLLNDLFTSGLVKKCLRILPSYSNPLVWALIESCLRMIEHRRYADTKLLIKRLELFSTERDFTAKIGLKYLEGCYHYVFKSVQKGEEKIDQFLIMLRDINAEEMFELFSNQFSRLKSRRLEENECNYKL